METKFFLKSKEVWVLGIAILYTIAKFFGLEFDGLAQDVAEGYQVLSLPAAFILRLFFTGSKLTFN